VISRIAPASPAIISVIRASVVSPLFLVGSFRDLRVSFLRRELVASFVEGTARVGLAVKIILDDA
jgi:hypothetical protein